MSTKPLALFDFDGVFNAIPRTKDAHPDPDALVWTDWVSTQITTTHDNRPWTIWYSPTVISFLNDLASSGEVEVMWLTTWCEQTQHFSGSLGAVDLPWLGVSAGYVQTVDAYMPTWWKYTLANKTAKDRPLAWIDDDLAHKQGPVYWAELRNESGIPTQTFAPHTHLGITPQMILDITSFLDRAR